MAPPRAPHQRGMEFGVTLSAIVMMLGLTAFAGWRSGRPRKDSLKARWISWRMVTVFAGAGVLLAMVHLLSLLGLNAGGSAIPGRP